MNKKKVIILFISVAVVIGSFTINAFKQKTDYKALNILLITLDTTRADYIGAYGHQTVKTPNIDSLCRSGVMFQNCYSPVPLTLPAHCSIFTGEYPVGHRVRINGRYFLNKEVPVLSETLKKNGYHTHAVIAAFVLLAKFGLGRGFDVYDDSLDNREMYSTFKSEIPAEFVYKKFKKWFETNKRKKFFSWVHFYDPHSPYNPPAEYSKKGAEKDEGKLYEGEIEYVDKYVGQIIADLKAAALLEKTLIVIVGDHGEAFGEHGEYGHSVFCYEENLKVPLIFYNEKIFKKRLVENRANLVDIMPTLLDLLAVDIPGGVQGKSLLPLLQGKKEEKERTFYVESMYGREEMNWAPLTGIITGNYKYISLPQPELYDLEKDKNEKDNLVRKKLKDAQKCDQELKKLLVKYAVPAWDSQRELSKDDLAQLQSLGYVSALSGRVKGNAAVDPKKGVVMDNELKGLSKQINNRENLAEVEKRLKKVITGTPELKTPIVYMLLYKVYKERRDVKPALRVLNEGINEFPEFLEFRITLAGMLFDLGRYEEVVRQNRLILEKNPVHTQAYVMLGDVYDRKGSGSAALQNYRSAVELEPESIKLRIRYADMLMKYKKVTEAVEQYNSLLDKDILARDDRFLYKVAMLNGQAGNMVMAEKIFRMILQVKPQGKYYYYYALILSRNKKFREAIENMKTALDKYPGDLTAEQTSKAFSALAAWKDKY